ncbi:histidine phosphatase family protein [Streptomyces sp. NPDC055966]|uniref:histidine phosphatase family protein n=1 Tax=Streptomyces sp. NPDC055966 TaxID=3345669 RepID=UPI0035D8CAC6
MTARVMLVAPAVGAELREARFGNDGPLDDAGLRAARAVADTRLAAAPCFVAPSFRCRQTAEALGLASESAQELGDLDVGSWRGLRLDDIAVTDPAAVAAWLADPSAAPHGGESLTSLCARVGSWLDERARHDGRTVAVVEPAVIRSALVHALALPPTAFWRLDVLPLTVTELSGRNGRWNLRCGQPLTQNRPN